MKKTLVLLTVNLLKLTNVFAISMWPNKLNDQEIESLAATMTRDPVDKPIFVTPSGKLRGMHWRWARGGMNVLMGVPFATSDRFQRPNIIDDYGQDVVDATEELEACWQPRRGSQNLDHLEFNENCLYLNVYAPDYVRDAPVMFWIYGGSFIAGSIFQNEAVAGGQGQHAYDGRFLAAWGNVVVVTVQYRLGPFGFLCAGTDDAPGNYALWDEIAGLKWVHKNIRVFGGDPSQITMFGESAGGMQTSMHTLSPISTRYFKRAIVMSGASFNPFIPEAPTHALGKTYYLGKVCGCSYPDLKNMIACLKQRPPENITQGGALVEAKFNIGFLGVYDTDLLPYNIMQAFRDHLKDLNKEILTGTVRDEGALFVPEALAQNTGKSPEEAMAQNYTEEDRQAIVLRMLDPKQKFSFTKTMKKFVSYLATPFDVITKEAQGGLGTTMALTIASLMFDCPTYLYALYVTASSSSNHVWSYRVMEKPRWPFLGSGCQIWMGVCHADELVYVFAQPFRLKQFYPKKDYEFTKIMVNVFTEFANNGKPPPEYSSVWKPHSAAFYGMGTLGGLGLTTSVKQLHLQNHQMPYLQNAFQIVNL